MCSFEYEKGENMFIYLKKKLQGRTKYIFSRFNFPEKKGRHFVFRFDQFNCVFFQNVVFQWSLYVKLR